jgi:hypothetical protein
LGGPAKEGEEMKRDKEPVVSLPANTEKGFIWGPVEIERLETEDISGSVLLGLKTVDVNLEIFITRAGMVRIYVPSGGMVMVCALDGDLL